jgi:hypothetical protein
LGQALIRKGNRIKKKKESANEGEDDESLEVEGAQLIAQAAGSVFVG